MKYSSYRDSGVEWLGEIPEHWKTPKLKLFIMTTKGFAFKSDNFRETGIPVVKTSEIKNGTINESTVFLPKEFQLSHKQVLLKYKDIIVSTVGSAPEVKNSAVGQIGIVPQSHDGSLLNQNTVIFSPDKKLLSNEYLPYILKSQAYREHLDLHAHGTANQASLNLSDMLKFVFPFPPLQEQQTIANYLDTATAKIDTLIEKQTKLIALLKEKRQSLVDEIVHHKTTQNERLGYIVDQVLRPVTRKHNEEYEALGLYNRGRGLFHKPLKSEDELGDSDFYWVEEDDLILSGQFAWEGSVALATKNENNCIVSHRYPILRGKENIIDTEYLWAYFTTKEGDFILNEHSVGSAGRNRPLNINTLLKEKIPVPPIEKQKAVANIVQAEQKIKILIDKAIVLLKEKRTVLISLAVTGKIDVREKNMEST